MALITCHECGKEISDQAAACPHCGAPEDEATGGGRGAKDHTTNHTNDDDSAQNKNSQKLENPSSGRDLRYGAKRIRTADPLHAMQVLYQLSYGPNDVEIALEQSFVIWTLHREAP